jgi:multidrug efflux system membrane fusion protein
MRFFPILTAVIVVVVLFYAILQRETLVDFAGGTPPPDAVAVQATGTAPVPAAPSPDGVHVMARKSVAQSVDSAVLVRGRTEAARDVVVRAETQGLVVSEPLRKGAFVQANDVLCKLDAGTRGASLSEAEAQLTGARARVPEAQARVAEAQARVAEAAINDTAAARLSEGGFASATRVAGAEAALSSARAAVSAAQAGLQSGQAGVQSAEAALERAHNELSKLEIRAPFAGLLESDTAELGALLQAGAACATVIQLDPIKLVGFVPETQVDKVMAGARASARLASGGGDVQGRVTFLARSADEATRTFRVEVQVPNPDLSIRDGQTVEIVITGEGQMAHLLPGSALTLDDAGRLGVRIIDAETTAQFMPVTLLRDTAQGVWLAGLPAEASVILVGQEYVTDGVAVRPSYEELSQ